MEDHKWK